MATDLTPQEGNRLLGETLRGTTRLLTHMCRILKEDGGHGAALRVLIVGLCGQHNRTRALIGRLLPYAPLAEPCCWPGPISGRLPCGPKYPTLPLPRK